jgi:hypothetical protein
VLPVAEKVKVFPAVTVKPPEPKTGLFVGATSFPSVDPFCCPANQTSASPGTVTVTVVAHVGSVATASMVTARQKPEMGWSFLSRLFAFLNICILIFLTITLLGLQQADVVQLLLRKCETETVKSF